MKNLFRNYGLSIVLFWLFIGAWLGQFLFQLAQVANEAQAHGQQFQWGDFIPEFGVTTLENWQSEFLQLFTFVILTSILIHRGSGESKDSDEQMQASLNRIEQRLETLEGKPKKAAKR